MPIPASLDVFLMESVPDALLISYQWVREWQTLLAVILLIFALDHFSRAIIEAFRDLAEVVTRSTRISAVTSASRAPPYAASQAAPYKEKSEPAPPPFPRDASPHPGENLSQPDRASNDLSGRLDALRNAIRVALAAIPPTQSKIGERGLKLYGDVAVISLGDVGSILTDQETLALGQELEGALAELRFETADGLDSRLAWESLARVNRLARALQIKIISSNGAAIEKKVLEVAE